MTATHIILHYFADDGMAFALIDYQGDGEPEPSKALADTCGLDYDPDDEGERLVILDITQEKVVDYPPTL